MSDKTQKPSKITMCQTDLGHRVIQIPLMDGIHNYQCTPFEWWLATQILDLKKSIHEQSEKPNDPKIV